MVNEEDMKKALDALNAQLLPNYAQVALKFGLQRTTLMRRHQGICTSRASATSQYHKRLTDTQEEVLITQINKLTTTRPTRQSLRGWPWPAQRKI